MTDSRSARQELAIQKWIDSSCAGVWEFATGFGKTHTSLTVAKRILQKNPNAVLHFVVPTLFLKAQFEKAIIQQGIRNTSVYVINTYVREQRQCDFLLLDEIHKFLSEMAREFSKVFTICTASWKLGLSATLTAEEKQRLTELGLPVIDVITMQEALREGWIANHKTYNLGLELTFEEQEQYDRWNDIHSSKFSLFGHDFSLAMSCMGSKEAREAFSKRMGWREEHGKADRWSPQSIGAAANMWNLAARNRAFIVNHASAKYQAAVYLIQKFPVKTICFSESTRFASELASYVPTLAKAYHTQIQSEERQIVTTKTFKTKPDEVITKTKRIGKATLLKEAIAAFTDPASSVRVLSTARALDQGADFAGLRLGIETSGSGTIRQKVQRTGRVVRKDNTVPIEEQMAVYVHLFMKGTYEVGKLRRKQKGLTGVREVQDINDITF